MGNISTRLGDLIQETKNRKTINIAILHAAVKKSEADLASIKSPEEMGADIDPAHAVYASVQNLFSVSHSVSTRKRWERVSWMRPIFSSYEKM